MSSYIVSSGITSDGIELNYDDTMTVLYGGTANDTMVYSGGVLAVSSGGTANDVVVYSGGTLTAISGIMSGVTIDDFGYLTIFGGTATNIDIPSAAYLTVTITADTFVSGFYSESPFLILDGVISGLELTSDTFALASGGKAYATTVSGHGYLHVSSGGLAENTQVNFFGHIYVSSGGTANSTTVNSSGYLHVYEGGVANSTTVNSWGVLEVSSGGMANNTTVNGYGNLNVQSGGLADNTTVYSAGYLLVDEGGLANNTTVNRNATLHISSGGTANHTTLNSGGYMEVDPGVTANSTVVNPGASLYIYEGGIATDILENGGYVTLYSGDSVTFQANVLSGLTLSANSATLHSGTTATDASVLDWGRLHVLGGSADNTTVAAGGYLYVYDGTANGISVDSDGGLSVSGGTVTGITAAEGAYLDFTIAPDIYISGTSGGSAFEFKDGVDSNSLIPRTLTLHVGSGGTATDTVVSGGNLVVTGGGTATDTVVSGGTLVISYGGTATNIVWTPCEGQVFVQEGANVSFASEYSGVYFGSDNHLLSHTSATDGLFVDRMMTLNIFSGGTANNTILNYGSMYVSNSGAANSTTILDKGNLHVSEGATASSTKILDYGSMYVSRGGTATDTTVLGRHAMLTVSGTAEHTVIDSGGSMSLEKTGTANDIVLNNGSMEINGKANSVTVNSGGYLNIYGYGTATAIVENGGWVSCTDAAIREGRVTFASNTISGLRLEYNSITQNSVTVHSGTTLNSLTFVDKGTVRIYSGGKLTGKVTGMSKAGCTISAMSGAIIDFDISRETPSSAALMDNYKYEMIRGTPTFTITVGDNQMEGTYRLANYLRSNLFIDFSCTVLSVDGMKLGSLRLGQPVKIGDVTYKLDLSSSYSAYYYDLYLVVGTEESNYTVDGLVLNGGSAFVLAGEVYHDTEIYSKGALHVSSGGTADHTTIDYYGTLVISREGSANDTVVNARGLMDVRSGYVTSTVINSGGTMTVSGRYAVADSTTVNSGGYATIYDGMFNGATVNAGGTLRIRGCTATAILENGGYVDCYNEDVWSGRIRFASNTISGMNLYGSATVHSGTTVNSMTYESGTLQIYSGGKLTGKIAPRQDGKTHNCVISASSGGIIDFDISKMSPGSSALIYDFYHTVQGKPTYTITIGDHQKAGTYRLAANVRDDWRDAITIVNTEGIVLGTTTMGYPVTIGDYTYRLSFEYTSSSSYYYNLVLQVGPTSPYTIDGEYVSNTKQYVAGMIWHDTTICSGGYLRVFSGGIVSATTIESQGSMSVEYDGKAIDTVINGGNLSVYRGAASNTVINYGSMFVSGQGLANSVTVNVGGCLRLRNGMATEVVENGGCVDDFGNGNCVTFVSNTISGLYLNYTSYGTATVHSGTTAIDTILGYHGEMTVFSGGIVSNTLIASGRLTLSGGTATDTTVVSGRMAISGGATVNNTRMNGENEIRLTSGATMNNVWINSGKLDIFDGASANGITVSSGGELNLNSGAVANGITVSSGGTFTAVYGVSATDLTLTAGAIATIRVSTDTNITGTYDGVQFVIRDGAVSGFSVDTCSLYLDSGCSADGIAVETGMTLEIASGATATNIDWTPCEGTVTVMDGGSATFASQYGGVYFGQNGHLVSSAMVMDSLPVNEDDVVCVMSGGTANNAAVVSAGLLQVFSGGILNSATAESGGEISVASGGTANGVTIDAIGLLRVAGGTVNSVLVNDGGELSIAGGAADGVTVNPGGYLTVSSGGTATNVAWTPCEGTITIMDGAYVTFANEYSGVYFGSGGILVSQAETMADLAVNSGCEMLVFTGGTASTVTVNTSGVLNVFSGGVTDGSLVTDYGTANVLSGGLLTGTTAEDYGVINVLSGGQADDVLGMNGASITISSGGIANRATADGAASLIVLSGGVANVTTVLGGQLEVSGGVADGVTVSAGGYLTVFGGTATGIVAEENAILEFTITSGTTLIGTSAGSAFAIQDGTPSEYTIRDSILTVQDGGTVNGVAFEAGGDMNVLAGGQADNTVIQNEGCVYVKEGGIINSTTVAGTYFEEDGYYFSAGYLYVDYNGSANATTVEHGGYMDVYDGTINDTTVNEAGILDVYSGTVNGVTVNSGGSFSLTDPTSATGIVVGSGGSIYVAGKSISGLTILEGADMTIAVSAGACIAGTFAGSAFAIQDGVLSDCTIKDEMVYLKMGGLANDVTVGTAGVLAVSLGGVANGVTVNSYGSLRATNGGVVNGAIVNSEGYLQAGYGGVVNSAIVSAGGYATVSSGGVANDTELRGVYIYDEETETEESIYGSLGVSYNGVANRTAVNSGGFLRVASGGSAVETTVNDGGQFRIDYGGVANSTTVNSGGWVTISSGTVVSNTVVNEGGSLSLSKDAAANYTTVNGGRFTISYGTLNSTTVDSEGIIRLNGSTGVINNTILNQGSVDIQYGAANNTVVNSRGDLIIREKASANNVTVNDHGAATISGTAYNVTVNDGGSLAVVSGITSRVTVNSRGWVDLTNYGLVSGVTVNEGGRLDVRGKAIALGIVENGGYVLADSRYNTVTFVENVISSLSLSATSATIHSGTTANSVNVQSGGRLMVYNGGVANGIVENGGYVWIEDGAAATFAENVISGLTLSGTAATVHSATTLNGVTVGEGGVLEVYGGTLTGQMAFHHKATVSVEKGSVLNFDLTNAEPGTSVLVSNLAAIQGTPEYTMTIPDALACGKYLLATGADTFNRVISVQNAEGETIYDLTVDDWFYLGDTVCLLTVEPNEELRQMALTLTVAEDTPPVISNIQVSTTELTNQDVVVTADFSGTTELCFTGYMIGEGTEWFTYEDGVTVSENAVVYFMAEDAVGNQTEIAGCTVTNIDKTAPEKPVASEDVTAYTNGDVFVTAVFSDDSAIREYSLDGETWTGYTEAVKVSENRTVYFRGTDAAGNVSDVTAFEVANIDTTAPSTPAGLDAVVSGRNAALVWSVSTDDLAGVSGYIVKYSHDGEEFTVASDGTGFVLNDLALGTWNWSVQAVDAAGNVSAVTAGASFTVSDVTPQPDPGIESPARNDINGNGISDVTFQWTGGDYQIGFWMDGTSQWNGQAQARSAEWTVLGTYDVNADGNADLLMAGRTTILDMTGTYIGYYSDSVDLSENWHTIGLLIDSDEWTNAVGNLTGATGRNSVVWYSPTRYSLGAWTDGTDDWVSLGSTFGGSEWTLVGCGDFDGDGLDSVVMTYNNGQIFYSVGLDGAAASMGSATWSGWEVRAIGDFLGDGKDDMVLFHAETGSMVMFADGSADDYTSIGQLDAIDWFVVGAGDYNGDLQDDLLVRQYSTGMLGYYISGDTTQWVELGRGVDMDWTVIA